MVNFEEIKAAVEARTGKEYIFKTVVKNNGTVLTGLMEAHPESIIVPTVYIKEVEEDELEKYVDGLVDSLENAPKEWPDMDKVMTWPTTIAPKLVNKERNMEMIEANNIVYDDVPGTDLVIIYGILVDSMPGGKGRITVTGDILEKLGCTKEDLKAAADAYLDDNSVIKGMSEIITEIVGNNQALMMGVAAVDPKEEKMFVISTKDKTNGAGVIVRPKAYETLKEYLGEDILVLPSSIHEVIAIKNTADYEIFRNMVSDINGSQVSPEEQLSDNVYRLTANGLELVKAKVEAVA